jgi:hypothetical protein
MRANEIITEKWSAKYKSSINCSHPRGFSQRAHCAGKNKHTESVEMEQVCPDCGMCETHGSVMEIRKGQKDANGYTRCWPGKHAKGTKTGKNGGQVRNCEPNESQGVAEAVPTIRGTPKAQPSADYTGEDLVRDANALFTAGGFKLADKEVEPRVDNPKKINTTYYWRKKIKGLTPDQGQVQQLMIEIYNYAPKRTYWAVNNRANDDARVTPDLAQKLWRRMEKTIKDSIDTAERENYWYSMIGNGKVPKDLEEAGVAEGSITPNVTVSKVHDDGHEKEWHVFRGKEMIGYVIKNQPDTSEGLYIAYGHGPGRAFVEEFRGLKSAVNYITSLKEGVAEGLTEEFDLIESIIEGIAAHNGVDAEAVWEDLESLTEDELYAFAVTSQLNEDWQKANKQDRTAGMSQKAVNAYRRENPGSKLKTAVTTKPSKLKKGSKASKRRKSYCSRSRGQMKMHNISCAKTPDKAICKARRRWNC